MTRALHLELPRPPAGEASQADHQQVRAGAGSSGWGPSRARRGDPRGTPACLSAGARASCRWRYGVQSLTGEDPHSRVCDVPSLVLYYALQVRGGLQKGLLAFSLHGTDRKSGNP